MLPQPDNSMRALPTKMSRAIIRKRLTKLRMRFTALTLSNSDDFIIKRAIRHAITPFYNLLLWSAATDFDTQLWEMPLRYVLADGNSHSISDTSPAAAKSADANGKSVPDR